ncbi:RING-H2 finger protein ATL20-like [Fagus crenata]
MASSQIFFVSTFFFFFPNTASDKICETSYCGENRLPLVEFPFQLNTSQAKRCGYPGFNLSCDNKNQTTLTLPNSGDFHVDYINYQDNLIYITDPDDCFPRRFLKQSFNLLGSPFQLKNTMSNHNYTFYNCSFNKTTHSLSQPIPCLSSDNFTVFKSYYPDKWLQSRCPVILHAPFSVQLSWNNLNCSLCESGEQCALKSDTSLEVGCFDYSSTLSTRTGTFACFNYLNLLLSEQIHQKRDIFTKQ